MEEQEKQQTGKKIKQIKNYQIKCFKTIVIIMLTELGKRIDEQCDNFTKELVNIILQKLVVLTIEPPNHTVQYLKWKTH